MIDLKNKLISKIKKSPGAIALMIAREEIDTIITTIESLQKTSINWNPYDKYSREIESHVNHLVTNGHVPLIAQHVSKAGTNEYEWKCGTSIITWVTHWAKINLPLGG